MKVILRKPVSWFGPYQLAEALCFWVKKQEDEIGFERSPDWVHNFGTFLAGDNHDTWLTKFLQWYDTFRRKFPWNKDVIEIDYYDTWSMDHSLSPIILPMLKQLKATKHGFALIDDEDAPKHLQSWYALPKESYDWDGNAEARYEWVLNEMIWAFEQMVDEDNDAQFFDHSAVPENASFQESLGKVKMDVEGHKAHHARIDNGLRLFGKYFRSLWD